MFHDQKILRIDKKLIEKVMYARLEQHLENHAILSPNQFGFRKGHSTTMAISLTFCGKNI
jgi:hypothetical protein